MELPQFIQELNDSLETTAFMVIKNDSILYEEYWYGYSKDSLSNSFSMSKSWVSTLIGIAIKDGVIKNVNQNWLVRRSPTRERAYKALKIMNSGLFITRARNKLGLIRGGARLRLTKS